MNLPRITQYQRCNCGAIRAIGLEMLCIKIRLINLVWTCQVQSNYPILIAATIALIIGELTFASAVAVRGLESVIAVVAMHVTNLERTLIVSVCFWHKKIVFFVEKALLLWLIVYKTQYHGSI